MEKKREVILLIFLIILLFAINYNFIDNSLKSFLDESQQVYVERIIDGDTIVVSNNTHVRLLGINTPEKGEFYHDEAINFLSELILNKTVILEYGKDKTDLYGRTLAYILLDGKNINIEQVRNGFANFYIYDQDKYTKVLENAWNECIANGTNLCEKSQDKCADCIQLKGLDVKSQISIFYNKCSFNCDLINWDIKDEGRKHFTFPHFFLEGEKEVKVIVGNGTNNKQELFWGNETYVWTATGDSLFLRDGKGKLVLWEEVGR
ncbi:Staphylococcal nuclease homologue [uncultured archaeon]|nr:Staphylococcal nuclease homologue [uncultured archaeon]